jgi:hypothetical protein
MTITEKQKNFKGIEGKILKYCYKLGRQLMKIIIEKIDKDLMERRDKNRYRHKGLKKTVIKTMMGEVEYSRAIYETKNEKGKKEYKYLLDEEIGIKETGYISELLCEKIIEESCESSYRNTAKQIRELTGQTISHTASWEVVQRIGEKIDKEEKAKAKLAKNYQGKGKLETEILFEEQDGIWINMQGKSRKESGKSKEMKVAIAYDGSEKIGKNRYKLTNKVACANFESSSQFQKRKEGIIADTYNVDEINMRFLNGDGAGWIKQNILDDTVHFQLDPFHRNKAINTFVKRPEMKKQIMKFLYNKEIDNLLNYIEALANSVEDEEEQNGLLSLLKYFTNNKDGLVPCSERNLDIPKPPEGKEYRQLGTMEGNIFSIIGNRMKGRRACWSINGGNNMARILCLKATSKLSSVLHNFSNMFLPEKYCKEITTKLSSSNIPKSIGKGYNGYQKAAAPPPTPEFKWLRDLGSLNFLI